MADKTFNELKKNLPGIQKQVLLKNYTTFKIGGPAKWFFPVKSKEDLILAFKTAKLFKVPFFILGGGSNVLVSDKGFPGLVIKIQDTRYKIKCNKVFAGAGMDLARLIRLTANSRLSGLEWAAGIPNITVGGAIFGHAQAFGQKMSDTVQSVEAIDLKTLKLKIFSKKECRFSLKNSIFKQSKNFIIVSAVLHLNKKSSDTIKKQIKKNRAFRKTCHPMGFPSAGSTFVNPEVSTPAGYLIAKCGLAGKKIGKAQISEKHCNFIVNLGGAKAKDVLALIKLAKQRVKKTFNIKLEEEVQMVGFNKKL